MQTEEDRHKKFIILDKVKKEFNGFGSIWKFICSSDTLYIEELRFIADINGIKNTVNMNKKDLCNELEKLSTENKNKVLDSCQNETDISGDDVKDIPIEYFFSYEENGKHYCTDIRSAYSNIKALNNKNPYTNIEIPEEIRDKIVKLYEAGIKPEEQSKPTFSQLLANFSSAIPYLNSVELYKNAQEEQIEKLLNSIMSYSDFKKIDLDKWEDSSLEERKYILIENILADPKFDFYKYQLRQDYNQIFSGMPDRPLYSLEDLVLKISPELIPENFIKASREQVNEYVNEIGRLMNIPIIEDLEEFSQENLKDYKYFAITYNNPEELEEEEDRKIIIEVYKKVFPNPLKLLILELNPSLNSDYYINAPRTKIDDFVEYLRSNGYRNIRRDIHTQEPSLTEYKYSVMKYIVDDPMLETNRNNVEQKYIQLFNSL